MAEIDVAAKPRIVLVCGGSGTGKSSVVKRDTAKAKRFIAFDPDGEYISATVRGVTGKARLLELLKQHRKTPLRVAYVPSPPPPDWKKSAQAWLSGEFDFWARCAFAWGNCVAVAEELADVTTPGKAPMGWGWVVRKGRKRRMEVYAITQRPAESDKTTVGNATLTYCFKLKRARDRQYMADEFGMRDTVMLDALVPLQYIAVDDFGRVQSGRLTFPK